MDRDRIQRRIGALILSLAILGLINDVIDRLVVKHLPPAHLLTDVSILVLLASLAFFGWCTFDPSRRGKAALSLGVFLLSAPLIVLNGTENYYGLGVALVGALLLHRFDFLTPGFVWKAPLVIAWPAAGIILAGTVGPQASFPAALNAIFFLVVNLLMLYILFEEEIRELVAANRFKDDLLVAKSQEIARLEPLSVLGERVAHVTHSFKNNLNQISTALFLLEQVGDPRRAADKLREFQKALDDRIENVLMISKAGSVVTPEFFDVGRMLEGIDQVFLHDPSILVRAKSELSIDGTHPIHAVRWDFLLMVENILRNAVEAIAAHRGTGTIRIDLANGLLTIANDGGAIAVCEDCHDDCLACPRYGRPGQTTKARGTGHGLYQVMNTCRANQWGFRIRVQGEWTIFEIRLPVAV